MTPKHHPTLSGRPGRRRIFRTIVIFIFMVSASALAVAIAYEVRTNRLEARLFSRYAHDITWSLQEGESPAIAFPHGGPFDITRGYTLLPTFQGRLTQRGYAVTSQARQSPQSLHLVRSGIAIPYSKNSSAGLRITDQHGVDIFRANVNSQRFSSFESIPPVLVQLLLFRENRELFDFDRPFLNPAVEWDRFAFACASIVGERFFGTAERVGGSTLATQIVKFRHSDEGRTKEPIDKIKQMIGASLWSYQQGPITITMRQEIVKDYLNEMPLGAAPGYGAINGLGAGMWSWFGKNLREVTSDFALDEEYPDALQRKAETLKQVLALIISTQRPSQYLNGNRAFLEEKTNDYLRSLAKAGIISAPLHMAAMQMPLQFDKGAPLPPRLYRAERKGTDAIRTQLLTLLGIDTLYELDRLDLAVSTTLDQETQQNTNTLLNSLHDPQFLTDNGFVAPFVLCTGDPRQLIYSVALFERGVDSNLCRVQADTLDRPLNINLGARLELGSTAKLRALTSYLIAIDELAAQFIGRSAQDIVLTTTNLKDPLSVWVRNFCLANPRATREQVLAASLMRQYSGSPYPGFFTGGGLHIFQNFKKEQDTQIFTLEEGFCQSVNLVFIRLMKEVVGYHTVKLGYDKKKLLTDTMNPQRLELLREAADIESKEFLRKYYRIYASKTPEQRCALLSESARHPRRNWMMLYFKENPDATWEQVVSNAKLRFGAAIDLKAIGKLYKAYRKKSYNLTDEAFLLGKHPLEVWIVDYLKAHPGATWKEALGASTEARQLASAWLFKGHFRRAQDSRIKSLLERKAFEDIHRTWQSLGYPFQSLVPSLATAIGSSADRPANLAELIGIILNDGLKKPTITIQELRFAAETPYETHFIRKPEPPKQVMSPEVARTLRYALQLVVAEGTGRRIKDVFVNASGSPLAMGGKTGTGDNRFRTFRRGAEQVASRSINRTSTFVFFVDTFFGVVTAHVEGPQSAGYEFTSALAVQVLKTLRPALAGLIPGPDPNRPGAVSIASDSTPALPMSSQPITRQVTHVKEKSLPPPVVSPPASF